MKSNRIATKIENAINNTISEFINFPNCFLTEEDVRCYLFSLLYKINQFSRKYITSDGEGSIPVHCEIRWYGASKTLKYRSDIVVLDPTDLIVNESMQLPSKGYGFNKFWAIIEIKMRRINGESDNQFLKSINDELIKLQKIKREVKNNKAEAQYHVLCFDKKNDISGIINSIEHSNVIVKYVFSNNNSKRYPDDAQ